MIEPVAIVHENIPVIEVADGSLLDQLMADPKLAAAIVFRLGPKEAAIDPEKLEMLIKQLGKMGHLPKVVEA